MNRQFRETATYQALVNCLVRHLQNHRDNILEKVETCGPITDTTRPASNELDQVDHALTGLGQFDTRIEDEDGTPDLS